MRYPFTFPILEKFLVSRLNNSTGPWWAKFIPPIYFYDKGSVRIAERHHIKYKLDISNLLSHSIYFNTVYDKAWINLFALIKPEFHIIDVGANTGFLTLTFARMVTQGSVYSFEPDSENFNFLEENVLLNNFGHVKIFNTALGISEGTASLYKLYENNTGANRIIKQQTPEMAASETVTVRTLDFYLNEFKRVDLIKIDVEGFELFVLKGGVNLIRRWKPVLFVELVDINLIEQNCSGIELLNFIDSLEYKYVDANTMKPLDNFQSKWNTDIICFPLSQI